MSKKSWIVVGVIIAIVVIYQLTEGKPSSTNNISTQNSYSGVNNGGDYSASYYLTLADQYDQKAVEAQKDIEFAEEQLQNAINDQRGTTVCQENVNIAKQLKEQYEQLAEQYRTMAQQVGD
ncbi:hypothetical protein SDC9_106685 [bioreactor metagenome]|uniref:Uncharacterized protein n=1 Tax=bioreactor metagenome TaxID=1076179 RepID=A0A645B339_9ZZZZ